MYPVGLGAKRVRTVMVKPNLEADIEGEKVKTAAKTRDNR